jgi:GAF domain-containing protein/HAMP domain-containing protein
MLISVRDSRRRVSSIDIGLNGLAVRSIMPMFRENVFIGMVEVGRAYNQDFVQELRSQMGADFKIWLTYRAAVQASYYQLTEAPIESPSTELFYYAGSKVQSLPIPADVYQGVLENASIEINYVSDGQDDLAVLTAPLRAFQGQIIGVLEIAIPRVKAPAGWLQNSTSTLALAGGLALGAIILMGIAVNRIVLRPLGQLSDVARQQLAGNLSARVELQSRDEFEQLGHTLNTLTEKLDDTLQGLDKTIAQRTHDLERRSAHLEASAEVSRVTAAILEPGPLIQQAVNLIREHFGLYYVGLFLVDEAGEWAMLRAGTGVAGRALLARGHRIRVGEGMIGWSITRAQARVASQADADQVRLAIEELPDTRSEAAIPLRSRGQVLGALTVQSTETDAFDPVAVAALQTMSDHIAVALDNARLFAESQVILETTRQAFGQRTRDAWAELLRARPDWGYVYERQSILPAKDDWPSGMRQAERSGQTVQKDLVRPGEPSLFIPIKVRDNVIGVLGFAKTSSLEDAAPSARGTAPLSRDRVEVETHWTPEEVTLLEALAFQLGLALDSAQLYRDTERGAIREQLIGEVTTQMRETLDVETVLRTAAREVRQALNLPEVVVRLSTQHSDKVHAGEEKSV